MLRNWRPPMQPDQHAAWLKGSIEAAELEWRRAAKPEYKAVATAKLHALGEALQHYEEHPRYSVEEIRAAFKNERVRSAGEDARFRLEYRCTCETKDHLPCKTVEECKTAEPVNDLWDFWDEDGWFCPWKRCPASAPGAVKFRCGYIRSPSPSSSSTPSKGEGR